MSQAPFSLQPINSVMQGYAQPAQQLGSSAEPILDPGPQSLAPIAGYTPQMPQQMPQFQPQAQPQAAPPPSINDQLQAIQQQSLGRKTFGEQHPIWAGFLGTQTSPQDDAYFAKAQRDAQILNAIKAQQEAAATNEAHKPVYKYLANMIGVHDELPEGAVIGKDDIAVVQDLVKTHGAPALMKAGLEYNQAKEDYTEAKASLAHYNERKRLGLTDLNKEVAPVLPPKPVFNIDGINPFLDAGKISGFTGTAGEAGKTGENIVSHSATNATNLEGNKTQLAKLQAEINARSDVNQLARDKINQDTQQFGVTSGQKDTELGIAQTRAAGDIESKKVQARVSALKSGIDAAKKSNDEIRSTMRSLFGATKKGDVIIPAQDNVKYPQYVRMQNEIAKNVSSIGELSKGVNDIQNGYANGVTPDSPPAPRIAMPTQAPTGQTLNQTQGTIKAPKAFSKYLKDLH